MSGLDGLLSPYCGAQPEAGDYTGPDGLLYCGKCHAPKQQLVDFSDKADRSELRKCAVACKCMENRIMQEQEEKACDLFKQEMERRLSAFPVSDASYSRCTFAEDDSPQSKISQFCRQYVEDWSTVRANNLGILFTGGVGTGKSFYACAVANALLERRVPAVVTNFPRLLNILQSSRERQAVIDHLQEYELLVIDDLGAERDSSYAAEQIYSIIDARWRANLPLIITTNLSVRELQEPDSMQFKRIYDRVLEMCTSRLVLTGESRRAGRAEKRRKIARDLFGF